MHSGPVPADGGRDEAHAAARKFAAVAELMRRRPAPGTALEGSARMPAECDEFTVCELVTVLALSRWDADGMLSFAYDLAVRLPGTRAAFLDGVVNQEKAEIIARATAVLTPEEARAAEALVLGRAGRLTPSGLRSAIARAVSSARSTRGSRSFMALVRGLLVGRQRFRGCCGKLSAPGRARRPGT